MFTTIETTTGNLELNGGTIYYEVAGAGHPLVLIHAGVADSRMWDDQFPVFAEHSRVVRYDARGYGKSPAPEQPFSHKQDLLDLLRHLNIARAYLLGLSQGGQIAIDFTLEHPEMVDALVVASTWPGGFQPEFTEEGMRLFTEWITAWQAAAAASDYGRLADLAVSAWGDGPGQPPGRANSEVRERLREMVLNNYARHAMTAEYVPLDPPAVGRLSEISVPTLVIAGDLDTPGTIAAASVLKEGIASAKKVIFPGAAHMVNMEQPEEFNTLVLDFLRRL